MVSFTPNYGWDDKDQGRKLVESIYRYHSRWPTLSHRQTINGKC